VYFAGPISLGKPPEGARRLDQLREYEHCQ
jgi:hypothetical protein